ncbi:MAG: hypothetical protein KC592_18705 [Nitrospira sp.]|nr:hypothetical protein [Nitrospira sp.]MCW5784494.1 hypothetical protein [Nitrospirales bacterium]
MVINVHSHGPETFGQFVAPAHVISKFLHPGVAGQSGKQGAIQFGEYFFRMVSLCSQASPKNRNPE